MAWTFKENLKPQDLDGISKDQIDQHFDVLYKGYVTKTNELQDKVRNMKTEDFVGNATYSELREIKKEEVFATNGARLHEGYFGNLKQGAQASGPILDLIKQEWGSYERWEAEFKALGLSARGWVILAYDWEDRKLHNYLTDIHSEAVWSATPLLILDVYEHAYFIDYGTGRAKYLDAFLRNVDWSKVNERVQSLRIQEHRAAS